MFKLGEERIKGRYENQLQVQVSEGLYAKDRKNLLNVFPGSRTRTNELKLLYREMRKNFIPVRALCSWGLSETRW